MTPAGDSPNKTTLSLGLQPIFHLCDLQGFGQISCFLKHWRSPKASPGKMLWIAVSWLQFCTGISTSVFTDTDLPLIHLESNCLTSPRQCLKDIQGSFHLSEDKVPPRQQANDVCLMEIAIQCGQFGPKDLKRLNHSMLWLNMVELADVPTQLRTSSPLQKESRETRLAAGMGNKCTSSSPTQRPGGCGEGS